MATAPDVIVNALKAMVAAGASDKLLGAATREWLGAGGAKPSVTELPSVEPRPPAPRPPPLAPPPTKQPTSVVEGNEVVNIVLKGGKRSSVSFPKETWQALCSRYGDPAAARTAVREAATFLDESAPNRSLWLRQKLLATAGAPASQA